MAPLSCIELSPTEQSQLLVIARGSIAHGFQTRQPLKVAANDFTGTLAETHGNFVTLMQNGTLRGCVGAINGTAPLAQDIARTAYSAAFNDSRFAPLAAHELDSTLIDISVLSQPEPLAADNLGALLEQVRPHKHGLIIEERSHRATLLPKVWEKVPNTKQFIMLLLDKAGLPPQYWSDTIRFYGYEAFSFAEDGGPAVSVASATGQK
jgi:hypothetical protein